MESVLFSLLFFILPFLFFPQTSEVFELNKITALYLFTILILTSFFLQKRRFKPRHNKLNSTLILFLLTQSLAALFSIETYTSIFGYYGRFNGGLLSLIAYTILFFVYSNTQTQKDVKKHLKIISVSALIISVIAILEHFNVSITCYLIGKNISTSCWSQDIQARVFSTFGQPNWLAAFLAASIALTSPVLMPILFLAILFTRSRSGLLAVLVAYLIYWLPNLKNQTKLFTAITGILIISFIIFNPLRSITNPEILDNPRINITPSSQIRRLVWKGAIKAWQQKPLLGWGPETFAFSYQSVRPTEHNLTSEWNFTYNKAHNEYLNYLTTSGVFGLFSYLLFICIAAYKMIKNKTYKIFAGFTSLLITNFFGFSTVTTNMLLFIFPAMTIAINNKPQISNNKQIIKLNIKNLFIITIAIYATLCVFNFWRADYFYSKGMRQQNLLYLTKATILSPRQDLYKYEKAYATALIDKSAPKFDLTNSRNNKHLEIALNTYLVLSAHDKKYLANALEVINKLIKLSPTYAINYYQKALILLEMNNNSEAQKNLEIALKLKPNYEKAAILLHSMKR